MSDADENSANPTLICGIVAIIVIFFFILGAYITTKVLESDTKQNMQSQDIQTSVTTEQTISAIE